MITQFALRLMFGMSLMWLLMPRRDVTAGFFKIQMRVVLGLGVLAVLTATSAFAGAAVGQQIFSPRVLQVLCGVAAFLAYLGSVFWLYEWRRAGTIVMLPIAALSGTALIAAFGYPESCDTARLWLQPLSEFASAAMLGSMVVGMLLGHWYLTSPTMTTNPLHVLNNSVLAATLLRLIVSAIGLTLAWPAVSTNTQITWLALRWLAGILGPFLVWFLVWRILKYKNTQSATGVLFSGVILVFIGEMTASLLFTELPYPV